jgi:hypothetical protein
MSRTSLRRQIFQKNLDLLLQNGSLDTVDEEVKDQSPGCGNKEVNFNI